MKPHLDRLWSKWRSLPDEYKKQHLDTLNRYVTLFNTSNAAAWNEEWEEFAAAVGPEYGAIHIHVSEAMKVAEAHEAGFPNPQVVLPRMADTIFSGVPSNAVVFVQSDLFETMLRLRKLDGKRPDVLVLNLSRLIDITILKLHWMNSTRVWNHLQLL